MRKVLFAGAAAAVVYLTVNCAIIWLNRASNLSVAAGYFLMVTLIALLIGVAPRLWRRL